MKKTVLLVLGCQLLTVLACTARKLDPLSDNKRFDQVTFATAHNAFSNSAEGFKVLPQQKWSMEDQLKHGIRGFMLDTWLGDGNKVLLCHGGCSKKMSLVTKGSLRNRYRSFRNALKMFGTWLEKNRQEILVIFLENHVHNDRIKDEINSVDNLKNLLLTAKDWDPDEHNGEWPTIGLMRQKNKRVVIFNEEKVKKRLTDKDDPFFFIYDYVTENQYGTVKKSKVCKQRSESKSRRAFERNLYLFNFFAGRITSTVANAYDNLRKAIETCAIEGVPAGKRPNFIALDFVDTHHDALMRLVNRYNR